MDWLSLLGLSAFIDRWRAYAIEAAIAAEDRTSLFRLELQEYKRGIAVAMGLALAVAVFTVVLLTVASGALLVQFWDTPHRIQVAWSIAGGWLVLWLAAAAGLWSLVRKAGNGFALTRRELAQDWREIKEQL